MESPTMTAAQALQRCGGRPSPEQTFETPGQRPGADCPECGHRPGAHFTGCSWAGTHAQRQPVAAAAFGPHAPCPCCGCNGAHDPECDGLAAPAPEPEPKAGPRTIYLVACVAAKRDHVAPARELYQSPWFRKARRYVEAQGCPWFILSAGHFLLDPDTVVAPYERTLLTMSGLQRMVWADKVLAQISEHVAPGDRVVILAGERYREHIEPRLQVAGIEVDVPMRGLGIGQQLAWLGERAGADTGRPASCSACGQREALHDGLCGSCRIDRMGLHNAVRELAHETAAHDEPLDFYGAAKRHGCHETQAQRVAESLEVATMRARGAI